MKRKEPQISSQGMFLVTMGTVVGIGLWVAFIFGFSNSMTHTNLSKLPPIAVDPADSGGSGNPVGGGGGATGGAGSPAGGGASAGSTSASGAGGSQSASSLPFPTQHPASLTLLQVSMPGYAIFKTTCAGCHGDQLQGVIGPELLGIGNVATAKQLDAVITKGFSMMPPSGGLSDPAQVKQVAEWLAAQKQK